MPRLQVKLLGGFEARLGAGTPLDIAAKKTRALLAYLALPPGRAHSRDKLVGLLWSDRGDEQARNSLRQALTELGRALAAVEPSPLIKGRNTLALDPRAVEIDALQFELLAASSDACDLRQAAALYAGDLLDGFGVRDPAFEEWLVDERQRLRTLAATVFKKLLSHEIGPRAIAIAQRLLALDPLQEEGHRALMRLYSEAGEVGAALRQYETCCDILNCELGVTPSLETEALHQQIRDQLRKPASRGADQSVESLPVARGQSEAAPASKPSIAILPFVNMSGDADQEYFSDGITEDIITELSRYRELFVIARNSSFQYRGKSNDMKQVGRELGVEYLGEGSIRKVGNRIRVTAQLVATATGNHIWAEHYDCELNEIFAVQDDVTQTIAATAAGRMLASGAEKARRKPTKDWVAYDCFLQGRERLQQYDPDGAERHLQRALEFDPDFAQAHAWRAFTYIVQFFFSGRPDLLDLALIHAQTALSLDIGDAWCHSALGMVHMFRGPLEAAGPHLEKSVALNPNDVEIALIRATWLSRMGRTREALENIDNAVRRDPFVPDWYWEARTIPLLQEKRFEEVIETINRMTRRQAWHHYSLAIAYAHLGMAQEAKAHAAEVLRLKPDYSEKWVIVQEPYKNPADLQNLLDGLRKAGLPK